MVLMMTAPNKIYQPMIGNLASKFFAHSVSFDGMSHNDAAREAAIDSSTGPPANLIEYARLIEEADVRGEKVMLDSLRPNVAGRCNMIRGIAEMAGLTFICPP